MPRRYTNQGVPRQSEAFGPPPCRSHSRGVTRHRIPRYSYGMPSARTGALLAFALGASLLSAGCGEDDSPYFGTTRRAGKSPSVLYLNAAAEPALIDPGRVGEAIGSLFVSHVFEGLSVYHPKDAHATQGVAVAWDKSDDNRFFRFHLRPEAVWSDGKRVTARDFAYAWARVLRPSTASNSTALLFVLLNGELFAKGQLKVTRNRTEVRGAAADGAPVVQILPAGAAVRILKTEGEYAQIALHDRLPTFDPAHPAPPEQQGPPMALGFVLAKELDERASVLGVRAVGDDVLEIEAERPVPYFADLTCYAALSPMREDVIEPLVKKSGLDAVNRPENLVTNGAYSFGEWKFHYEINTVKSPTYWRAPEVKLDRVVWMMVEDARSTLNLYKAGDLDYLGDNTSVPLEVMPFLSKKKDFHRWMILNSYWFELNTKKPPLDDVRVRRALDLAIDKARLVESVTRAGQIPATHFVPDLTGSGYSAAAEADRKAGKDPFAGPGMDFDPARARALLKEAGFEIIEEAGGYKAKGFPPIEILYNTHEGHKAIAVAVQDFWRRHLGVTTSLRNEEWKVMLKTREQGDFQIARGGWSAEYNHPSAFLDTFLTISPANNTRYVDPEYDRLIRDAAATSDATESIAKYRLAEKRAVDAMARIPLYFYTRSTLVKPWVKGFYPNVRNVHLAQWMWIDESGSQENRPAAEPREYPPPGRFVAQPAPGGAPP